MNKSIIYFCLLWASAIEAQEAICKHQYPKFDQLPHPVKLSSVGQRFKREAEGPLRIKVFYHKSVDNLGNYEKQIIKKEVRLHLCKPLQCMDDPHDLAGCAACHK